MKIKNEDGSIKIQIYFLKSSKRLEENIRSLM